MTRPVADPIVSNQASLSSHVNPSRRVMVAAGVWGGGMSGSEDHSLTEAERQRLEALPIGAAWVAGIAVGLMLIAWFLIWLLVYIPRGAIG
ncbi:MAG: hypothetical protein JOZ17_11280 [Acetobacteraceae bacterium]|nr:hypothetical protein [Acetobacteraceae bacterium]